MDQPLLMQHAVDAARSAAQLVIAGHRTSPAITTKASIVDLVTEFDLRSERLIRNRLEITGLPIVGEEEGGRGSGGPTWYIDPIDGTTNFAHGHPMFCVSIGLLDGGEPLVGAVVAPALQVTWCGCRDRGAFRNGEPCHVSRTSSLETALVATGFMPGPPSDIAHRNLERFKRVLPRVRGVRRDGSAALDLCMTADGTFDGYWELNLNPWDLAGGAAIVLSAGGTITGLTGAPPDYLSGNLLATNGAIHQPLLEYLGE